jgi:glucose/arabinose dehydrogenase
MKFPYPTRPGSVFLSPRGIPMRAAIATLFVVLSTTLSLYLAPVHAQGATGTLPASYYLLDERCPPAPTPQPAPAVYGKITLGLTFFVGGFSSPVSITHDCDGYLYVVEKAGAIKRVAPDGTVDSEDFLDITDRVDSGDNEEGLLGLAFHPDYPGTGYFYVNYTYTDATRLTRISRFDAHAGTAQEIRDSELILLTENQQAGNHNAGDLHFGPDGYLYIPLGDGGGDGTNRDNSQDLTNLRGSVIRIDVNSHDETAAECPGSGAGNYTVPDTNPTRPGTDCDEIWSYGLRNPWRSSFDRLTGDLYIADVGQGAREEINFQPVTSTGDENYGWPCREGLIAYTNAPGYCGAAGLYDDPIDDYPSTGSPCNSVTGGYVYRGSMYPDMAGRYLYTDYCTGEWWEAYQAIPGSWTVVYHTELTSLAFITTFGEGADGNLYVARSGSIYRVVQVP